jgi:hypothetical protein
LSTTTYASHPLSECALEANSQDVIETVESEDLLLIKTNNQSKDKSEIKRTEHGTREIPPQVRRG